MQFNEESATSRLGKGARLSRLKEDLNPKLLDQEACAQLLTKLLMSKGKIFLRFQFIANENISENLVKLEFAKWAQSPLNCEAFALHTADEKIEEVPD